MKQDDGAWQLERLSAAEAPELHRAVDAAKQQLPSARELAALAASLPLQGLPLAAGDASRPVLSRLRKHWLVIGSAVFGAIVICVGLARLPVEAPSAAISQVSGAPADLSQPALVGSASAVSGSPRTSGNRAVLEPTPSTPDFPVGDASALVPDPALAASGSVPGAAVASSPAVPRPAPSPATSVGRSLANPRSSQSPAASAQGSSLGAGSKVQPSEVELLRDARLALRSSPALALGLTEQHSAWYPHGTMVQERELIAISALALLGRHAAVLSRAQRFEHDFPGSPYRKQIAQIAE